MVKDLVPCVHFYDQDFVDMYDRTWVWVEESWKKGVKEEFFPEGFLASADGESISLFESCLSALSLSYSNQNFDAYSMIDFFYKMQAEDGRISERYSLDTCQPIVTEENPLGLGVPLLPFVEYIFYHKIGNKKRLKEVVVYLEKYLNWISENFQRKNGLYSVPYEACHLGNVPREGAEYTIDFNAQMATAALYMSSIGDILNDKELAFRYKRQYFSLKTRINSMMWDSESHFYYDLDKDQTVTVRQGSHENEFEIRDGQVRMLHANCRNHDCIQQGAISRTGETIVCLPHKVVLEVTGGEEDFDVVAQ